MRKSRIHASERAAVAISSVVMKRKVTFDGIVAFLKVYLILACCWPLPANASKLRRLCRYALRYFCCTNTIVLSVAMGWTIFRHKDDTLKVLKLGCQFSVTLQIPLQAMLFAMQDERLQYIVLEMEGYHRRAQRYEKEIFQQYIDRCKLLYVGIICLLIITGFNIAIGPVFLPQLFPIETEYPFDAQYQPLKTIIFAHQILGILQSITQVSANILPALLLWFVAARFHILSVRFRTVTNVRDLMRYTYEHDMLLRYAKEVTHAIRYIALLCVTFSTGAVIFGVLTFISRIPWSTKWMFLAIACCAFIELYMYAWPADNVISTSSDVAFAAYDSLWYKNKPITQKIMLHVILRSQYPVTVSVPCLLPTLSMSYYASYISTVFSYMTLIRILIYEE